MGCDDAYKTEAGREGEVVHQVPLNRVGLDDLLRRNLSQ